MSNLSYLGIGVILLVVSFFWDELWQKDESGLEENVDRDTQTDTKFNKGEHISKKDLSEFEFQMVIDTPLSVNITQQLRIGYGH